MVLKLLYRRALGQHMVLAVGATLKGYWRPEGIVESALDGVDSMTVILHDSQARPMAPPSRRACAFCDAEQF